MRRPSVCRQRPAARAFVARIRFPCAWGAAGETCRETLLRKASEPAAHVAGFGFHLEGFGPPNLPQGVFRRSGGPALAPALDLSNKPGIAGLRPSKPIFRGGTRTIVSVPPTARQCSANGQGARKSPAATAKRGCGLLVLPILRQPDRRVSHAAIAVAQTPRCEGGGRPIEDWRMFRAAAGTGTQAAFANINGLRAGASAGPQFVDKGRLRGPLSPGYVSPAPGARPGKHAGKPCCARLPNPPRMSPGLDSIWRASALQTSPKGSFDGLKASRQLASAIMFRPCASRTGT